MVLVKIGNPSYRPSLLLRCVTGTCCARRQRQTCRATSAASPVGEVLGVQEPGAAARTAARANKQFPPTVLDKIFRALAFPRLGQSSSVAALGREYRPRMGSALVE